MPSEAEIIWAAGLFEGEGSLSIQEGTPQIGVAMTDLDVVEHFARVFDLPPPRSKKVPHPHKPQWHARANGEKALEIMALIEPWLHSRRRERLAEIRAIREAIRAPRDCEVCGRSFAPKRRLSSGRSICSERCREQIRTLTRPRFRRRSPSVGTGQGTLL